MTSARIKSRDTAFLGWGKERLGRKEGGGEGRYRHIFAGFCGVSKEMGRRFMGLGSKGVIRFLWKMLTRGKERA